MSFSRNDAEALRDAIQALFVHASNRSLSMQERREAGEAWRTIERLTDSPIPVPGEDAATWTFRLRRAAWEVFNYAVASTGTRTADAVEYLQQCQDTLRVLPTAGSDERGETDRRDNAEGNGKYPNGVEDNQKSADAAPLNPFPATLAELLTECQEHRRRIVDAMRQGQQFYPCTNASFAAIVKGTAHGFLLPSMRRLINAAIVLDLGNVPAFAGEPQTEQEAVAVLDALISSCQLKQQPASECRNTQENGILVDYLSKHPDAAEDDTLNAMNAALPPNATSWTLVGLRKNRTWREHVERRIGEYMDKNPDASLERIGKNVGYAKSTVSKSAAYQACKEKRKADKLPSKVKVRGNLSDKQLACLESGKQLPRDPARDALHAESNVADGNALTDPNAFRSLLLNIFEDDSEYRGKVNRLNNKQLPELAQHVKDTIDPDNAELLRLTVEQWLEDRSGS